MPQGQLTPVLPDELLTRFALEKTYFRADGTVRHNAFMPACDGGTSVFRTSGQSDDEIWEVGTLCVANYRLLPLLGRIDIFAFHVFAARLSVIADEPPLRHANITNWPGEHSKQKVLALELAAKACFLPA